MKATWITAVLLFCSFVRAKTYYVDQNASGSADANLGTAAQPWKTIAKAATAVVAGDSVIVKNGTYTERISFASGHSGLAGKKIVFKADPRRTVFMQGFQTDGVNYLRIEGFDITCSQGGWNGGGIWISSSNLEIVDNYCHDIPGTGHTVKLERRPVGLGVYRQQPCVSLPIRHHGERHQFPCGKQ